MNSIEKIMEQAQVFASGWATVGGRFDDGSALDEAEKSKAVLREMIAAALADAERKGAEAMRMLAARVCGLDAIAMATRDQVRGALMCEQTIRALPLPLPTGERKDEPLVCDVCGAECADPWHYSSGERRHMHACDACWPGVRKQGGGRQAVLLTDAAIAEAFLSRCPAHLRGEHDVRDMQARPDVMALGRAVEAAVLAANNLEVRRG